MLTRGVAVALAGLPLVFAESAVAADASGGDLDLRWQAPNDCPGDLKFLRAVEDFLGGSSFVTHRDQLAIDARVVGDATNGYAAKLAFRGVEGTTERVLEHPDCAKLAEAAALLTALAIDPDRVKSVQEQAEAPPAPPAPPPPEPVVVVSPNAAPVRDAPNRAPRADVTPRARFNVGLGGLVTSGSLPSTGFGVNADLALRWRALEVGLGGRYWPAQSAAVPGTSTANIDVSLATAALRLCLAPGRGAWSVALCARLDTGAMIGSGDGVEQARTRTDLYTAFGGAAIGGYSIGRLTPLLGVEALALGSRPLFGVLRNGRDQEVFRPKAWQMSAFLGLAYAL